MTGMVEFQCLRCGHCCLEAGPVLNIEQKDVDRWIREGRQDILDKLWLMRYECRHCRIEFAAHFGNQCPSCKRVSRTGIYYWLDEKYASNFLAQTLGNPRCPFLRKIPRKKEYVCRIQETKPDDCREFPDLKANRVTKNEKECIEWDCKGYQEWSKRVVRTRAL